MEMMARRMRRRKLGLRTPLPGHVRKVVEGWNDGRKEGWQEQALYRGPYCAENYTHCARSSIDERTNSGLFQPTASLLLADMKIMRGKANVCFQQYFQQLPRQGNKETGLHILLPVPEPPPWTTIWLVGLSAAFSAGLAGAAGHEGTLSRLLLRAFRGDTRCRGQAACITSEPSGNNDIRRVAVSRLANRKAAFSKRYHGYRVYWNLLATFRALTGTGLVQLSPVVLFCGRGGLPFGDEGMLASSPQECCSMALLLVQEHWLYANAGLRQQKMRTSTHFYVNAGYSS
eukprot:scaffold44715_cov18-Tisochrysis_lutea.AAC.2